MGYLENILKQESIGHNNNKKTRNTEESKFQISTAYNSILGKWQLRALVSDLLVPFSKVCLLEDPFAAAEISWNVIYCFVRHIISETFVVAPADIGKCLLSLTL